MVTKPIAIHYKDPAENLDYSVDWSPALKTGESVTASSWVITPKTVGDTTLLTGITSFGTNGTTIWLSAGTDGGQYDVTNTVVTNQARTFERTFRIILQQR